MVSPRGQAHGALSWCKRSFAEARGPNARDPGVWPRPMASGPDAKDCGIWSWSPSGPLAFRAKPTLRRLLLQVLIPELNI